MVTGRVAAWRRVFAVAAPASADNLVVGASLVECLTDAVNTDRAVAGRRRAFAGHVANSRIESFTGDVSDSAVAGRDAHCARQVAASLADLAESLTEGFTGSAFAGRFTGAFPEEVGAAAPLADFDESLTEGEVTGSAWAGSRVTTLAPLSGVTAFAGVATGVAAALAESLSGTRVTATAVGQRQVVAASLTELSVQFSKPLADEVADPAVSDVVADVGGKAGGTASLSDFVELTGESSPRRAPPSLMFYQARKR